MAVLEVVDLVVAGERAGALDERVGDLAQGLDLGPAQHLGHDEVAVVAIEGDGFLIRSWTDSRERCLP